MKNILISIDKLNEYDMFVSEVIDIVDNYVEKGWGVDIYTHTCKSSIKNIISNKNPANITFIAQDFTDFKEKYDALWVYRGYIPEKLSTYINEHHQDINVYFRHFYEYSDLYIPYGCDVENDSPGISIALSEVSQHSLEKKGIDSARIKVLPFCSNKQYFEYPSALKTGDIEKVLYIGSNFPSVMEDLLDELKNKNKSLNWLDTSEVENIYPEDICSYDVVICKEFMVPKVLTLGIPVFIFNENKFHGYINDSNFHESMRHHFSGDNLTAVADARLAWNVIAEELAETRIWTFNNKENLKKTFSFEKAVEEINCPADRTGKLSFTNKQVLALSIHAKSLTENEEKDYLLTDWLKEREISEARKRSLLEYASIFREQANIGIVIICDSTDEGSLALTIKSLRCMVGMPDTLYFLSEKEILPSVFSEYNLKAHLYNDINSIFEETNHNSLLFITAGDEVNSNALLLLFEYSIRHPEVLVCYFDELAINESKNDSLILKPDCNVDLLRSYPYIGRNLLINVNAAKTVRVAGSTYQNLALLDLTWKLIEIKGPAILGRLPEVITKMCIGWDAWLNSEHIITENKRVVSEHLSRIGIQANITEGSLNFNQNIEYILPYHPLVSIIIITRDNFTLLNRCIESLLQNTRYLNYEIVIADNGSVDKDMLFFLEKVEAGIFSNISALRMNAEFNFSLIANQASREAKGEILLFLDNDTEVIQSQWLDVLLQQVMRPEVGLVGPRLEYYDGRIQHGGFILGVNDGVENVFDGYNSAEPGYLFYLNNVRNVSALSSSCLMIRKNVFDEVGGFSDDVFKFYYGDVDLALKLTQQGYLHIWTPYARVKHMGGGSRLFDKKFKVKACPDKEDIENLKSLWGEKLFSDSSYHPHMSKSGKLFTLSPRTARTQAALPGRPYPVVLANHINWFGCGNHRIIQPFKALEAHSQIEGGLNYGIAETLEVAQLQPDVILMELVTGPAIPELISEYRKVCSAKIIVEYDDFLINLPVKNDLKSRLPKNLIKNFRRVMESVDWVVVSTNTLAEAYSSYHDDIRVAHNRLAEHQWGHLKSEKLTGKKIRVGWAGGNSHRGDLDILKPIIKHFQNEVEWVFMGMKPDGVHCEYHPGVPFDLYPEKLASLNLDLALVPLEINFFNECKSNLRLLEIGTCGVPIIATDIEPYRCGLPVTLVSNKFKDWVSAIQEHINEKNWLEKRGDLLRNEIHQKWYLRESGLDEWRSAWLPK